MARCCCRSEGDGCVTPDGRLAAERVSLVLDDELPAAVDVTLVLLGVKEDGVVVVLDATG